MKREELLGKKETKPFECVGTIEEVNACLTVSEERSAVSVSDLLSQYDGNNNLPEQFEAILKDNLFKNN